MRGPTPGLNGPPESAAVEPTERRRRRSRVRKPEQPCSDFVKGTLDVALEAVVVDKLFSCRNTPRRAELRENVEQFSTPPLKRRVASAPRCRRPMCGAARSEEALQPKNYQMFRVDSALAEQSAGSEFLQRIVRQRNGAIQLR